MIPARQQEGPLTLLEVLEPSGGGSGRHFIDLCRALSSRGHKVTAVYSPLRAEARFVAELKALPLTDIIALPMRRSPGPSDLAAWRGLQKIIAEGGPFDIVHGHSSKAGALSRLRFGQGPARVYTPHAFRTMDPTLGRAGALVYGGIEAMLGRLFSEAVICVSKDEYRHAKDGLHIPEGRLHTVVNGVAPPPQDGRASMRQRLGLKETAFAFGFVGRLSVQKAPERLVEAFRRIATLNSGIELVMIGSGELEDDIRRQVDASGLGARIHMVSDIAGPDAMQAFDGLVMPSRYEAMSYVMLEAAAAGLPMVLTDVGGASTVLDDGENGYLVDNVDDVSQLASAMAKLADPALHGRLKAAAAARSHRYGLEAMVDQTEAIYRRLLR